MIHTLLSSVVLAATGTLASPAAPLAARQEPERGSDEVRRLERWPELGEAGKTLTKEIQRLRKARTPEMAEEADLALRAAGAGIVPELLPVLGKERDDEALARVEAVLLAVTGAEHTRLLAPYFGDASREVRVFALRRCGAFPDPGLRPAAEAALSGLREQGEKADALELYAAALCAASAGSVAGFDVLVDEAGKRWAKRGVEMRAALEGVRGPEATTLAAEQLAGERDAVLAGLYLLAGCGDEGAVPHVRPFLDSDDNQVRVAAINALRGIVAGEPPLERLPVFEAIELAKEWKRRV